ncbi:glycosyltransferase family 39 protein [Actinokineospora sp.]|uniref:glycosyltransferase family 39 protein n=1 Tax=Actinokineospora sp. TaxID=1872133 RepID=UPI003D6B2E44
MRVPPPWSVAAATVVAAAAALRIARLAAKSLWFDETYSVFVASLPIGRLLTITALNDAHPPLYYLMLHVWMRLFGDGEIAVRLPSMIFSVAVVLVTWLFGRRLVGPAAALVAAALVAIAPSQVAAGQEARMYGLLSLTALCSWWALWTAVEAERPRAWFAYVAATAAMVFGHYYGFFVIASQAIYLVWRRPAARVWQKWVIAGAGVVVVLLPWLPAMVGQISSGRAWPAFRPPLSPLLLMDTMAYLTLGRPVFDVVGSEALPRTLAWVLISLAAAAAIGGYRTVSRDRGAPALLVCAGIVPVVSSFAVSYAIHVFAPRYLLFALPPLAMLAASGIATTRSPGWMRTVVVVGLGVMMLVNASALVRFYRQPRLDVFDWRKVSQTLAAQTRDGDVIVFLPGFARIPVNYYFRGPEPRIALTPNGADVIGPGGVRLPAVVSMLVQHPRVWIVTVPPVPPSVETLIAALGQASYTVEAREAINMARLLRLERTRPP